MLVSVAVTPSTSARLGAQTTMVSGVRVCALSRTSICASTVGRPTVAMPTASRKRQNLLGDCTLSFITIRPIFLSCVSCCGVLCLLVLLISSDPFETTLTQPLEYCCGGSSLTLRICCHFAEYRMLESMRVSVRVHVGVGSHTNGR